MNWQKSNRIFVKLMRQKKLNDLIPLNSWGFGAGFPFIIAGPCGVESDTQINEVARSLRGKNVNLLRGGIWKPRTRPDSFQGIGEDGLLWLKNAGLANQLPVAVEVAHPRHVDQALKAGIDCFWIGARTTVNPFLVQEIAQSLSGVDIPVFVKNPICDEGGHVRPTSFLECDTQLLGMGENVPGREFVVSGKQ